MDTKLSNLLKDHQMTIQALSNATGISRRTLEAYTSGRRNLANAQAHLVIEIADALNIHPKDLI